MTQKSTIATNTIHHLKRRSPAVAALMEESLYGDVFALERFVDSNAVFRDNVPIVECVRHQGGCLQWGQVIEVIATGPELVVVAGHSIESIGHLCVSDG